MGSNAKIPVWRKAIFAVVVLLLSLTLLESGAMLLAKPDPMTMDSSYTSVEEYLAVIRKKVKKPRHFNKDAPLVVRVPENHPGAQKDSEPEAFITQTPPEALPQGKRHFVVVGGSAAHGFRVKYHKTFFGLVQTRLRKELGQDDLTAVVLARPAWELRSQIMTLKLYLSQVKQDPAAVVLYAGNNEAIGYWKPLRIGTRPFERLSLYRLFKKKFKPPKLVAEDEDPFKPEAILSNIWHPQPPMKGAGFWRKELKIYLENYSSLLRDIAEMLRERKIPLVLVALPLNLDAFEGRMVPQSMTFKDVGIDQYDRLEEMLRQAFSVKNWPDRKKLEELVELAPDGPLQLWALGQLADRDGRYSEALALLRRAKNAWWGMGFGMITMGQIATRMAKGAGIDVVDTSKWFNNTMSVRKQVDGLFMDICHLSPRGHELLAQGLFPVLRKLFEVGEPASVPAGDEKGTVAPP